MMVATGLPITPKAATATAPPTADAPAEGAAADGGFLGALMQMLTSQEPAVAAGAGPAAAVVTQLLDDPAGDVPDDIPMPDGASSFVAPIVFAAVQPADIRAAQQLARQSGGSSDSGDALTGLTGPAATLSLGGAGDSGLGVFDLLAGGSGPGLQSQTADPSAVGLQSTVSQPSATESSVAVRTAAADPPAPRQIHTPVGTPGWSDELGTQLHLMADKGHSIASLRLSPEHLGPLEVQISIQDNQASVWFGATNGDTRAALEQALPRLRELFAAQGMSLMQSGVFNQSQRDPGRQLAGSAVQGMAGEGAVGTAPGLPVMARRGLVDAYA